MRYEQLGDQDKDAQEAIRFIPKSIVQAASRPQEQKGRLASPNVGKDFIKKVATRQNLGFAFEPSDPISRRAEEEKNVRMALGIGSIAIILLIYFLFLR